MARPLRIEHEGALYHVTARGSERGKIFFSKADYEKFKQYLTEAREKHGFILQTDNPGFFTPFTLFRYHVKQRLTCFKCPILNDLFDMSKSILYQESRKNPAGRHTF